VVPQTGVTSNFFEQENLTISFALTNEKQAVQSPGVDSLNDVLDVLAEWDEHLNKAGVDLGDLEPGL